MCLAIPGRVIEIKENGEVLVDYGSEKRLADFSLIEVSIGDFVVINNKMVVAKVDEERAKKFLEVI